MYKPNGASYEPIAELGRLAAQQKLNGGKRHTGPLPHGKLQDGETFVGPDGKLYFRSHSGQIHRVTE